MKLATSTNIMNFDKGKPYMIPMSVSAQACAKAGYHYVDANLCGACRTGQPLAQDNCESWVYQMKAQAEELGIEYSQAHAYWTVGGAFNDDLTRKDGEWGEEMMRRSVIAAEVLGVKWMVVHPYTIPKQTWYDYEKSFAYNREYFSRWGEFYADHHVGMAIENMLTDGKFRYCVCAEELLELIDAIDYPMVQICIDTGHAHLSKISAAKMIRQVGSHLKATHIADNHQNRDEHFVPFNGTIDWTDVVKALREIHYEETFAFEVHHLSSMFPAEVQQHLVNFSYELGKYLLTLA